MPITAKFKEWKIFDTAIGTTGKCLVMALESEELHEHHNMLRKKYGASYDFPEYIPHMTVSYSYDSDKVPDLQPDIELVFDKYTFKGINPDFGKVKK